MSACPATNDLPPELVIEVATHEQKEGRVVGDLRDVVPGTVITPDRMAVRLAFFSVAGLNALEQQLRILREESFQDDTDPEVVKLRENLAVAREALGNCEDALQNWNCWADAQKLIGFSVVCRDAGALAIAISRKALAQLGEK